MNRVPLLTAPCCSLRGPRCTPPHGNLLCRLMISSSSGLRANKRQDTNL